MRTLSPFTQILLAAAFVVWVAAPLHGFEPVSASGLRPVTLPGADLVIDSGLDLWMTRGDGSTFFSFANDPLPADFFCSGSAPFAGTVVFRGVPVATRPAGVLGAVDTIVHRLDDAVFDEDGVARTRVQIKSLQLEGVELLKTECGAFRVTVGLVGEQPVTEMRISRDGPGGGRFEAEIAVNAHVVFTPVGHKGETLEVPRSVTFPPRRNSFWAHQPGPETRRIAGFLAIDSDFDGTADIVVPGTSRNFFAGQPGTPEAAELLRQELLRRQSLQQNEGQLSSQSAEIAATCAIDCHCDPGCGDHCLVLY